MIVDTSAIVAIFLREPGFERLQSTLAEGEQVGIASPTLLETAIVLSARLGRDARGLLARLLAEASISVVPFGEAHAMVATDAWLRYGKGRHRAGLNFGDCISYATSKLAGQPLLCVGDDFGLTDIDLA
ncbi:MAG: type II toxin-antitoxin system VapC family toxin [Bradymonadales bacterium]|nr:type II toxin-antitoxin system VapC family toxin [Bradymonadales bacterium]